MESLKAANLAIRFLLELAALAALAYWGFQTGTGPLLKVALGIGAPLLAAVLWGTLVAPRAAVPVSAPVRLVLGLAILGIAAVALAAAGRPTLAWIFALLVVVNQILKVVWRQ